MKTAVSITRIIVGVLFIVSGVVKANDPLGLSYKMQEFFEIWNTGLAGSDFFLKSALIGLFHFLHAHSLALSVIMIALEIIAGAALLIGWRKNFVLNSLLVLIVFFTFLTAYAYFSGKFKNCGCFGDCLPIEPFTSFMKDLVLLVLIGFLILFRKYIQPSFTRNARSLILATVMFLSVGLQWYALNYLPPVDCLPFKKGNNIAEKMKNPPGSIPDSFAIRFVYQREGKNHEFSPENLPSDLEKYTFVDRVDKIVRKGNAEPPIKGFTLSGENMDSTSIVLEQKEAFLLFWEDVNPSKAELWLEDFKQLWAELEKRNIPLYVVTPATVETEAFLSSVGIQGLQVFGCDNTAVRTAARTNPTLYHIGKGTVKDKFSFREMDNAIAKLKKT
ncbi:MAG TPA: BT_3928 family protein [Chitinophagaceae bacterium]|nr:BT_3928 family protein [Chitinophagaceae bacterium]